MAEVKVLIKGYRTKKTLNRARIRSTSTLIKSGKKNIVVDTSSFLDKNRLIKELKKEALTPGDIDILILTHLHLDHTINTYLFKNAKVFCKFRGGDYPGQTHYPAEGKLERTNLLKKGFIAEDVDIIETPGHTDDMISVVVRTLKGKVVIAGDAFPNETWTDLDKQPDPLWNDVEKFNKSRKKILEIADYIIPGHGPMFKVDALVKSRFQTTLKKVQDQVVDPGL